MPRIVSKLTNNELALTIICNLFRGVPFNRIPNIFNRDHEVEVIQGKILNLTDAKHIPTYNFHVGNYSTEMMVKNNALQIILAISPKVLAAKGYISISRFINEQRDLQLKSVQTYAGNISTSLSIRHVPLEKIPSDKLTIQEGHLVFLTTIRLTSKKNISNEQLIDLITLLRIKGDISNDDINPSDT